MGIYVKTSSGADCLDHSFKLVKTAMYHNDSKYNILNNGTTISGTAWNNAIWDDIGLTYVKDTSTYQNYFIMPSSGILILQCYMAFLEDGPSSQTMLAANLFRNDITQYTLYGIIGQYLGASFIWFQKVNKGDTLKILLAQTTGHSIVCSGTSSRLNFLLFS